MMLRLIGVKYDERSTALGLHSLHIRTGGGGLIDTYHTMKGMNAVDIGKM